MAEKPLSGKPVGYRDFVGAFRTLGLGSESRVLALASLSAFGEVVGGSETLVGAMLSTFGGLLMPSFTTRCMVILPDGPKDNAIRPQESSRDNHEAEIFIPDLPVDRELGRTPETLRSHPEARRSEHPLLSFCGVNADDLLGAQTLEDPWGAIGALAEANGDVLLLGVTHRVDVCLHYAEQRAGRRQFVRWALTASGVVTCPGWPGCRDGFAAIGPRLSGVSGRVQVGPGWIETVPLRDLVNTAVGWIREDPQALLCDRPTCPSCRVVRQDLELKR
jgi:aminoglycoside 3-N-acetyltransferase